MLRTTQSAKNLSLSITEDTKIGSIGGDDCEDETVKRSLFIFKNSNGAIGYLIPKARLAFIQLRKAFTKASIFRHFDPECHIRIETDALYYAICGVLNQLTLHNLGQWHLIAFYS